MATTIRQCATAWTSATRVPRRSQLTTDLLLTAPTVAGAGGSRRDERREDFGTFLHGGFTASIVRRRWLTRYPTVSSPSTS